MMQPSDRQDRMTLEEMLVVQHDQLVAQQEIIELMRGRIDRLEGRVLAMERGADAHLRQHRPAGPENVGDALVFKGGT